MMHDGVRVGFDLGGTGVRAVAVDAGYAVLASRSAPTPVSFGSPAEAVGLLATLARDVLVSAGAGSGQLRRLSGVGIGASGPVDAEGVIRNPDTLPAFTDLELLPGLEASLGVPARIDNDAVTAALAEHAVGAGRGADSLLHVTLGTGVGVAVLLGGKPLRGGDGTHPEAGHLGTSAPSGPCYCGRERCFEQAASRTRLQRDAAAHLGLGAKDPLAMGRLATAAEAGDAAAQAVFETYGEALADGLGSLMAAYRPQRVVLGGSASAHLPRFARVLCERLDALGEWISTAEVRATELDDLGGAIGAAALV